MDFNILFHTWKGVFISDFLRYVIFAGIAYLIFWVIGGRYWSHRFIQKKFPNTSRLWSEFKYSILTVVIFSINGLIIVLSIKGGLTKVYHDVSEYGIPWLLASILIMTIFHDTYFYWTHRFMHLKWVYKYVHRVHHHSTNPSPWAAHSFHPLEAIIQAIPFNIMLVSFPIHPIAITVFMVHMIVRNVIGHLGFELFPKWFLKYKLTNWLTTSTHHNLHHMNFHSNYGLYYSWWDNWMNTTDKKYTETFEEVKSRPRQTSITSASKVATKALVITLLLSFGKVGHSWSQSPVGKWVTKDEQTGMDLAIIDIDSTEDGLEGRISGIVLQPHQTLDPICLGCPGERQGKKVLGMKILSEFKRQNDEWVSGRILDPQNGETYKSKMWLTDLNTLQVRGYGGPFDLFYRTQTWVRETNGECKVCGVWKTIDDRTNHPRSLVKIYYENGRYEGTVEKLFYLPDEGPDPACFECEGEMHMKKIIGMKILWGFDFDQEKWTNGNLMDPGNGKTYDGTIWVLGPNQLKVRGYWGPFYRTQVWERI